MFFIIHQKTEVLENRNKLYDKTNKNGSKSNQTDATRFCDFFKFILLHFKLQGKFFFDTGVYSDKSDLPNYPKFIYREEYTQSHELILFRKGIQIAKFSRIVHVQKLMQCEKYYMACQYNIILLTSHIANKNNLDNSQSLFFCCFCILCSQFICTHYFSFYILPH